MFGHIGRWLAHGAKRTAHGQGGELIMSAFGLVDIGGQSDAETVGKCHLIMLYLVAFGKGLVPSGDDGRQI